MAWQDARKQELKNQFYDPELVWNVEGPTRKKKDAEMRKTQNEIMKNQNETQKRNFYQRLKDEKSLDLAQGR